MQYLIVKNPKVHFLARKCARPFCPGSPATKWRPFGVTCLQNWGEERTSGIYLILAPSSRAVNCLVNRRTRRKADDFI